LLKAGIKRRMDEPKPTDEDCEYRKTTFKPAPELQKLIDVCEGYLGLIF
jgi:hypothetical protein